VRFSIAINCRNDFTDCFSRQSYELDFAISDLVYEKSQSHVNENIVRIA